MTHSQLFQDFLDVLNIESRIDDLNLKYRFNRKLSQAMAKRTIDVLSMQGYKDMNQTSATTDLNAITGLVPGDQGYNGEYTFPTAMLSLIKVSVDYGQGHKIAKPYSITEKDDTDYGELEQGSSTNPCYRIGRNSYFLRPLPVEDVPQGIRVVYQSRQPVYLGEVANEAEMLALAGTEEYPSKCGDWVWRKDEDASYVMINDDNELVESWTKKEFEPEFFEQNIHEIFAYDIAKKEAEKEPSVYSERYETILLNIRELEVDMGNIYKIQKRQVHMIRPLIENFN